MAIRQQPSSKSREGGAAEKSEGSPGEQAGTAVRIWKDIVRREEGVQTNPTGKWEGQEHSLRKPG